MNNIDEQELSDWIGHNLFPDDFSNPQFFEASLALYSAVIPKPLIATIIHAGEQIPKFSVSQEQLNKILLESCQELRIIPGANWFQVNCPDNVLQEVVAVGPYSYRQPLFPLYYRLEYCPAEEGGVSIVGLLGKNKDWMLTIEDANQLTIAVHGSKLFCERVKDKIGITTANTG
jgi:hypothetical protein